MYVDVCRCMYVYVCICICMYACVYVCVNVCVYVCMCVCVCICICVCSIFWEKQVMVVCVQYALPYEWNIWTKQAEEVKPFLKSKCHTDKMRGRLNCITGRITSFHVLYFSARILLLLLKGIPCLQGNYFEEVEYFFLKKNIIQENWEEGWASLKHVLHPSTHDSFLARIMFLIWGNILSSRQTVTRKQRFPVTTCFFKSNALKTCFVPSSQCFFLHL